MSTTWNDDELKEMASQLSSPKGDNGIKTGERMAISNENMIALTIQQLDIEANEHVLEIGQGNGSHIDSIITNSTGVHYFGIDISETMIEEATRINQEFIDKNVVSLELSNGHDIDFQSSSFNKIFTVNTIYFWEAPDVYAKEIYRVLKPGGNFSIGFADRDFMKKLPFTKWKFQLYDKTTVSEILIKAGFSIAKIIQEKENIKGNLGEFIERDIVIITAKKEL
jgi:SAM-dependent methyltransferase